MKVTLLSTTPNALDILLGTKNVRLGQEAGTMTEEEKLEHLAYMRDTIKSSWEFVDYIFKIEGVTRAFTHQLVRTRTGSYAQETMRAVDATDHEVMLPESIANDDAQSNTWDTSIATTRTCYSKLLSLGAHPQDARGLLPTNITTSITAKFNLRTLHDMAMLRLCTRTAGEYQDVFREMRMAVLNAHPWLDGFLEVYCVQHGSCAFHRYGKAECPIYLPEMDNTAVREKARNLFWSRRYEAAPIAKGGKAQ